MSGQKVCLKRHKHVTRKQSTALLVECCLTLRAFTDEGDLTWALTVNHSSSLYLGAELTVTLGAAGTSVPSPQPSWPVCASHTTPSPRTSSRRPPWPAADTGRSSAASGSTPRFPCWTRTPPRCLREKAPSLLLETSDSTFYLLVKTEAPPALTPRAFPRRKHDVSTNVYLCVHYFSMTTSTHDSPL